MDVETISSENLKLNKELAYLFGVYLTDGSVSVSRSGTWMFQLQVIDKEFAEFTLECVKKLVPGRSNVNEYLFSPSGFNKRPCRKFCVGAKISEYKDVLESQTGLKHHIPFCMWDAPLELKKWFVAGVMDGDGWIALAKINRASPRFSIGVGKTEGSWILEFREFVQKMGVTVNKLDRELSHEKNGKMTVPMIRLHFNSESFVRSGLFFTVKRKQDRLVELRTTLKERPETKRSASYGMKI